MFSMSGNVLRSLSKCVYTNLAYEEYLLKNFRLVFEISV